jgi:hypothetical protein
MHIKKHDITMPIKLYSNMQIQIRMFSEVLFPVMWHFKRKFSLYREATTVEEMSRGQQCVGKLAPKCIVKELVQCMSIWQNFA